MRNIYILVILCTSFINIQAQTAESYHFNVSSGISLEDLSSGSTTLFGPGIDDASSDVIALPFIFNFAGTDYTQFTVSTNGLLGFGSTPVTSDGVYNIINQSSTYPIISPWWEDLYTASNGGVIYSVIGSVNRKLVVEWKARKFSAANFPYNKTFQIWLFEGTNKIQFVYGAGATGITNSCVGIASATTDFQQINTTNNTSSSSDNTDYQTWPGNGTAYSFTPDQPLQASITVNGSTTICNGGSVMLTASSTAAGSASFQWYKDNVIITGANQDTYTVTGSGDYTVVATYQLASATSSAVTITIASAPQVTEQHTNMSCHGQSDGSITLTTDNNNIISWSGPNGYTASTSSISGLVAGTYTYFVSSSSQCTPVTGTITLTEPDAVTLSVVSTNVTCYNAANGHITVSTNGTYTIIDNNGSDVTSQVIFAAGNYTINASIAGACYANPIVVTITQPAILTGNTGSSGNVSCYGANNGSVTIVPNGGTSPYTFSLNGVSNNTGVFNNLAAGSYNISITDANGCSISIPVNISQPLQLLASKSVTNVSCYGSNTGSVAITATGGTSPYTFIMNGVSNNNGIFNNLTAGSFSANIADVMGCSASISVIVSQPAAMSAVVSAVNGTCNGSNNGSINVTNPSGGSGSYQFHLNNGGWQSSGTFAGLANGPYDVQMRDASNNGCIKDLGIKTISHSGPAPVVSISATETSFCSNLTLTANPASALSYLWSNGSTASAINLNMSNPDGITSVIVTGQNGCTGSGTYNYIKQNILNSYTLLGFESVILGKNNTVNGAIGNTGVNQKVEIDQNSVVFGFIKAAKIRLKQPVTVSGELITSPANVSLPAMYLNTATTSTLACYFVPDGATQTISNNYNLLYIGKSARVTITGSIYGYIYIDQSASVTFTSNDISISGLITADGCTSCGDYTTETFGANAIVRIKTFLYLGAKNRLNSSNATLYVSDPQSNVEKVSISSKDTRVNANIYVPKGILNIRTECGVNSSNSTSMTGKFLSEYITSDDYVVWNSYDCNSTPNANAPVMSSNSRADQMQDINVHTTPLQELKVEVQKLSIYPNPNSGSFMLKLNKVIPENATILIYDSKGSLVINRLLIPGKGQTLYFDLQKRTPGTYLLMLVSKEKTESTKFIIEPF